MHLSKEEKTKILEEWRKSGKKPWTYAREKELTPQTFMRWIKKEKESGFVEIPKPKFQSFGTKAEILIEKGEVKIHIPLGIGKEEYKAVLEGLGLAI